MSQIQITVNEEYEKRVPELKPEEYQDLTESISEFGQEKLIERDNDSPRKGAKVYYSLTENGRKKYKYFHNSSLSNEQIDEEKLEKLYQLLFFVDAVLNPLAVIKSEQELEYLLSTNHKSKDDLLVDFRYSGGFPRLLLKKEDYFSYSKGFAGFERLLLKEDYKEIRTKMTEDITEGKIRITENTLYYNVVTTKFKSTSSDFDIWKEDHHYLPLAGAEPLWQLYQKQELKDAKTSFFYYIRLSGVSISNLFRESRPAFLNNIDITDEEVMEGFARLEKDGIIRPINDLFGEKRYSISPDHELLRELLRWYWKIFEVARLKMELIWQFFRRPTYHEEKWFELFYGEKLTSDIFSAHRNHRQRSFEYRKKRKHKNKTSHAIFEISFTGDEAGYKRRGSNYTTIYKINRRKIYY